MIDCMIYIKSDYMLYTYFKYHSYWYKILKRNPLFLKKMIEEAKVEYKLTTKDKIEFFGERIKMINSLLSFLES